MTVTTRRGKRVDVADHAEASRIIRKTWGNVGGSAFYRDPTAGLIEEGGAVVAHVSFNGRVWRGADRFANAQIEVTL